jgi:hypothetical protein
MKSSKYNFFTSLNKSQVEELDLLSEALGISRVGLIIKIIHEFLRRDENLKILIANSEMANDERSSSSKAIDLRHLLFAKLKREEGSPDLFHVVIPLKEYQVEGIDKIAKLYGLTKTSILRIIIQEFLDRYRTLIEKIKSGEYEDIDLLEEFEF